MKNNGIEKTKENREGMPKNRFLLIFVCIFVSAVLIFGVVLGIVSAVKKSKTAVSFKGTVMDVEAASFFATQYKYSFMGMLSDSGVKGVEDTLGFWNKDSGNGKSYGDILKEGVREYISQVLVTSYLYDRYTDLSKEEKELISTAVEETVTYKAQGSKKLFNEAVKEHGFSYSSYKNAVAMSYKSGMAQSVICGDSGENLKDEADLVSEYLSEYTHVKLLFIRTETTFELDSDGNPIVESDGSYSTRELTDKEKLERQELISEIRAKIEAIGTSESSMGKDSFDYYLEHNDEGDRDSHDFGYYFHPDAAFTKAFEEEFEGIAEVAYNMPVDSFSEAEVDFGVCFIYKYEVSSSDIEQKSLEECFTDFYSNLSEIFFVEQVANLTPSVKFDKKFDEIDILLLPYNHIYLPVF